jgi:hypothetical protein
MPSEIKLRRKKMPNEPRTKIHVERIILEKDRDKIVAVADIKVGDVAVRGLKIWKSAKGKLSVFFPSHKMGEYWEEYVSFPKELHDEVVAKVISAYEAAQQPSAGEARKNDKQTERFASSVSTHPVKENNHAR